MKESEVYVLVLLTKTYDDVQTSVETFKSYDYSCKRIKELYDEISNDKETETEELNDDSFFITTVDGIEYSAEIYYTNVQC
jgi:hypothetical protein